MQWQGMIGQGRGRDIACALGWVDLSEVYEG
jgi:hypothetical protein